MDKSSSANKDFYSEKMSLGAFGWVRVVRCKYHPNAYLASNYREGDSAICTECGLVVDDRFTSDEP